MGILFSVSVYVMQLTLRCFEAIVGCCKISATRNLKTKANRAQKKAFEKQHFSSFTS